MLWGAILVCVMRLKIDLTAMRRAPWAIKKRSLACRCPSPFPLSSFLSPSLYVCIGVVHLGSSCFLTIHKCYFYASPPSVAEVQRSVCGKGRCIHTRLTLKMLSQFLPDYHNNIIIIIIICIIIILINSFQRSVKNKFSLILLPCDAMRWPFRVICMPLC